ncbi:hypothetical protein EZJ19_05900 [Parasulfuritortus cantonensis]|uniref:TonB-dependent receptor n=1 Tax=Parasulfuritortus cantonensis TaxID=2528202 RepID=A0A4R1BFP4_9PROT|nr:TonB-dependent receptor [Parasulfuritortus cantonensis]TCJ15990.1 hypothetical protein EZJ19_05900 [Parasulfuritortus cantonensis]
MKRSIGYLSLLAACGAGPAAAAEPSEDYFLADLPTVLTASRLAQSTLDAAAPVTVIDRETIQASGFTEIHDLFRLVPGFQVADWPKGGAVVAHHGMGSSYPHALLVLLDGRSVVNPVTGDVDWQSLPVRLEDIERVEVVRGPNQASYGALAFNGVINIITRQPGEDEGGSVAFSRGERGFTDNYARIAGRGESLDWRLSASSRGAEPFHDKAEPYHYYREINKRQTLWAAMTYRPGGDGEFTADLGLTRGDDRLGSTLNPVSEPYHDRDLASDFLQLVWRQTYAPGSEWSMRFFHYRRDLQEEYPVLYGNVLANLDVDIRRDDLEWQQVHTFSDTLQGVWGAGLRRDSVESAHYFYGEGKLDGEQWQMFGNLDWRFAPDWLLHVGGMAERHYNTGWLFSPRVALNYAVAPSQSIRVSVGKGYRATTLLESDAYEVYTTPGGLPVPIPGLRSYDSLDPERVSFSDLGYVGRFAGLGLQVDARIYAETYSDIIWVTGGEFQNLPGEVHTKGAELALDWRHPVFGRLRLAHAATLIDGGTGFGNDEENVPKSAPRHSTSLLWSKELPWGLLASLGYYHVGNMVWLGDGKTQPAYERFDARLAKRFGKRDAGNEIAFTVQNMNGEHLEFMDGTMSSYTERQAFVTLRLGW